MSQIDQFTDNTSYSVDDFVEASATPPVTSLGSNKNKAAHTAMLVPDLNDAGNAYQQINSELDSEGDSGTADIVITNARGENLMGYRRAASELLVDPSASEEWKIAAIGAANDPNNLLYSPRGMVATKAATQTVKGETEEAALQRGIAAAGINQVLQFQRDKQQFYNELQLRADKEKTAAYVSMAEDFVPMVNGYKEARVNRELMGDKATALRTAWDTVWTGNTVSDRKDWFNKLPLEDRMKAMDGLMGIVSSSGSTILMPDEKDNTNFKVFRETVESGAYEATDQTIDNILGVLDAAGVGSMLRTAGRLVGVGRVATKTTEATARTWERRFTTTDVQPTTPSQTIRDVNPEMGRNIHNAVTKDDTGDVASAMYGTSREDAIAHDITGEVGAVNGSVPSKIYHPERDGDFEFMPDADILDFVDNSGASWLTPSEKRVIRSSVTNDFRNAVGMVNRKEMTTINDLPDGVQFSAVYGPTDNGWSNAGDAIEQATYALKQYGVTKDEVSVLARVGDEYHPVPLEQLTPDMNGDFLLQVNTKYKFNTADAERDGFEALDVANNFLDRYFPSSGKAQQGTLQSNLLDPQSMFRPELTKGATTAGLRGARLEQDLIKMAAEYTKTVKEIPSARRDKMFSKIRGNNQKGESFNYANLVAEGFTSKEINALEKWKGAQDTIYSISNRDLIKTYRNRGYGVMEHPETGTRLIVKPIARTQTGDMIKAFDPVENKVVELNKEALTDLYSRNGQVARTNTPMQVDGLNVEYVLDRNAVGSTYVRSLKDSDTVLNYRKGYYSVKYTNPHFIERKVVDADGVPVRDASGREQWKAVATAGNVVDAKRAVERLAKTTGGEHRFRNDLRGEDMEAANASVLQTGGMSSQRIRGQRLEEALGDNQLLADATHIQSPIESMISSMQSLSARVSARDWMETAKQRFIAQYGDVLPVKQGQVQYPKSRAEIGGAHNKTDKKVADARSTWEYIRQQENGFVNSIDDGFKAIFNQIADLMGHKGFGKAEEAVRSVANVNPSQKAKGVAFSLLLATNPLRQLLVQSHQMLMLGSVFPRYTFTHLADDLLLMMNYHLGGTPSKVLLKASGRTEAEASAMFKALKESNISAGITKHEMVRESLMSIADDAAKARLVTGGAKAAWKPVGGAISTLRKVGFDFGEYLSSSAAFLAHYDEAIKKGRKIDMESIEDITAQSRNFVYNMDRAGAMPYNHNSLAIITQFLQVPHKAITQMFTNQMLKETMNFGPIKVQKRHAIATYMLTTFGTGAVGLGPDGIFGEYIDPLLPKDPVHRESIVNGLETVFLNRLMGKLYGEPVGLDYSSLAPLDVYGVSEFISSLFSTDIGSILSASPSGSLVFGNNPRIAKLANSAMIMAGIKDNYENDPVKWSNVGMDAANLFSGLSNAFKAQYALQYGRKIGALGGVTDSNVNSVEAVAAALGLPTQDETKYRKAMESIYEGNKGIESDVKKIFQLSSSQMAQDGMDADSFEYLISMSGRAMQVFKGNPKAMEVWNAEMKKQMADKDTKVIDKLMEASGWAKPNDVKQLLDKVPNITPEQRDNLKSIVDYNLEYRQDLQEKK